MLPYASWTGTRRNLEAIRTANWGLMLSATGHHGAARIWDGCPVALDNGAWTAHQQGTEWDEGAFWRLIEERGAGATFIVVPDIVGGGLASLRRSESWLPRLESIAARRLIAVQQGMDPGDVAPLLGPNVGVFVGGADIKGERPTWKERTMGSWCALARSRGAYAHVGRVNSARRIRLCALAGADSFDGTSATRFSSTVRPLDGARRQMVLGVWPQ